MKLGLNYMGSKNQVAFKILDLLPKGRNFYDLFAGGCAMTHAALLQSRYEKYYCNDINPMPVQLFWDCARGNCPEPRWVSHEEFDRVKSYDAYAACCFSFSGDWMSYAYPKEIEPYKKALHHAIANLDFSFADALRIDLHGIEAYDTIEGRRLAAMHILKTRHASLERHENLCRLQSLQSLQSLHLSYLEVNIEPESVVYCDPPYKGTSGYVSGEFSHAQFYDWCRRQAEPLFISEYSMPDDFVCVGCFSRRDTRHGGGGSFKVCEKLFIPGHQREMYLESRSTLF